ncbi:MAG: polysaccharide deacetylase family protein [Pyrinomonadaceae bacterium]|jgi:peptidoglycan/xylan/chitin deacetylase (PgdA/CDA1 family)|nr:polysaccharide deacetylase family protein [Acidobacteriota bacterium]
MTGDAVFLMYHELEAPGRPTVQSAPGYVRYVLSAEDFRRHLAHLKASGQNGLSVGEALAAMDEVATNGASPMIAVQPRAHIAITFDDGCETDLLLAAPLLKEVGFNATFYVVTGFTGQRGYMNEQQVRELSEMGFEIGSHSQTHSLLSDLDAASLRSEIVESKERLEQMTGRRIEHFSCPGGRWSKAVAAIAVEAGYASVVTSRPGKNSRAADRFRLARMTIMRETGVEEFERLCRAELLLRQRTQGAVLTAAKRLLGNSVYERLRSTVLD